MADNPTGQDHYARDEYNRLVRQGPPGTEPTATVEPPTETGDPDPADPGDPAYPVTEREEQAAAAAVTAEREPKKAKKAKKRAPA